MNSLEKPAGPDFADAFEEVVAPIGTEAFISAYWGRQFVHVPGGSERFANLLSWTELNAILETQAFDLPRLKLFREGKELDQRLYVMSGHGHQKLKPGSLVNCLGDGATLILDSVHLHAPAVRRLALSFERALRADTVVNLYAGWRTQKGFDLHWDRQDTFILQVAGRKRWQVYEPTRLHPLGEDTEKPTKPTGPPVWEAVLNQGEALYLPRGWWHVAFPVDEPSLHLTVTVVPPAGPDVLAWVAERLKRHPDVRRNVPMLGASAERAAYLDRMRALIVQEWSEGLLEEFVADWDGGIPPSAEMGLPLSPGSSHLSIGMHSRVRLIANRNISISKRADGVVSFQANGTRWDCPVRFEHALTALSDSQSLAVADLCEEVGADADAAQFVTFLTALQMGGAIWVDPAPPPIQRASEGIS